MRAIFRDLKYYLTRSEGKDQREFYDIESRIPLLHLDDVSRFFGKHKKAVMRSYLGAPQPGRNAVVEFGCGVGDFARELARTGFKVCGIDISWRKIEKARRLTADPNAVFLEGDIRDVGNGGALDEAIGFTARSLGASEGFPLVVASDVLEHVPLEPMDTIKRILRWTAPQATLVVCVPDKLWLADRGHVWRYLPDEWEDVFRAAGLSVVESRMSRLCLGPVVTPIGLAMVCKLRMRDEDEG